MEPHFASLPRHVVAQIIGNVVISTPFEAVQELRTVNRLFHDEILFATYVSHEWSQPQCPHMCKEATIRLMARRALQGHLVKFPHHKSTADVADTVRHLERLAKTPGTAFALYLQTVRRSYRPCQFLVTSIFTNPISGLVCDALVLCYTAPSLLYAIYDLKKRPDSGSLLFPQRKSGSSFLSLLTACYTGDMGFVLEAMEYERTHGEASAFRDSVSSCLHVVSQMGHTHIMQHLLETGFDVNHRDLGSQTAIRAAAKRGDHEMLDLLLRPEYGLKRIGNDYNIALYAACDHRNTATRLSNVKFLYLSAEDLDQPRMRKRLLFGACRRDDLALARWLLTTGPVDLYSHVGGLPAGIESLLHWLAKEGRHEFLAWLLQVQPPSIFTNDRHRRVLARASSSAAQNNHLATFLCLAKFFEHKRDKLCVESAYIEDGLKHLAAWLPYPGLEGTLFQKTAYRAFGEESAGAVALQIAIRRGRTSNIRWLLERGVRSCSPARVNRRYYDSHLTEYKAISDLIVRYANPAFNLDRYFPLIGEPMLSEAEIQANKDFATIGASKKAQPDDLELPVPATDHGPINGSGTAPSKD